MIELPEWLIQKLAETDIEIRRICKSDVPQMQDMLDYVLSEKGKQIRPMMTFLCSKLTGKSPKVAELAAVVEICHVASLIHDDVIDDGEIRRGHDALQKKYGKEMAVYCGDYMIFAAISRTKLVNKLWYKSVFKKLEFMCNGEINQYYNQYNLKVNENDYIDYLKDKTAALFEIACLSGAREAKMNRSQLRAVENFANCFGIMFQLVDDMSDWISSQEAMKKKTQTDFINGYYTMPVIYALQNEHCYQVIEEIAKQSMNEKDLSEQNWERLYKTISQSGGFEYTYNKIKEYQRKAEQALSVFKTTEERILLSKITEYISNMV